VKVNRIRDNVSHRPILPARGWETSRDQGAAE
jgi:hypothetical protein